MNKKNNYAAPKRGRFSFVRPEIGLGRTQLGPACCADLFKRVDGVLGVTVTESGCEFAEDGTKTRTGSRRPTSTLLAGLQQTAAEGHHNENLQREVHAAFGSNLI